MEFLKTIPIATYEATKRSKNTDTTIKIRVTIVNSGKVLNEIPRIVNRVANEPIIVAEMVRLFLKRHERLLNRWYSLQIISPTFRKI